MKQREELNELENELVDYYFGYYGVPAPKNTYTENLWKRIEWLIGEVGA